MAKKYLKIVLNTVFLYLVFRITVHLVFKDQEISQIMKSVHQANNGYLVLGLLLSLIFVCSESVIIHYLLATVKQKVSLLRCIVYSFVGFFFSAVTPSATGGQPMQAVWMKRDHISVAVSSCVLMIVTVAYKVVLMLLCLVGAILEWDYIQNYVSKIWILVIIGVICNVSFVIFLVIALFRTSWLTNMIGKLIFFLGKIRFIKHREKVLRRIWKTLNKYNSSADYIKKNKHVLFHVLWITVIQRLCLFSVTYVVYCAFGLSGVSPVRIIALQTVIALAVDSLPLPGAMGASESSFLVIFATIFGEKYVLPGMLLSRGLTYYAMLIISAVITLVSHFAKGQRKKIESGGL